MYPKLQDVLIYKNGTEQVCLYSFYLDKVHFLVAY